MRLRDHDQPCEHEDDAFPTNVYGGINHWDCRQGGCPGGREVAINWEAAATLRLAVWAAKLGWSQPPVGVASDIVAAALEDSDGS